MIVKIVNFFIDLIYPPRCCVCDEIIPGFQKGICKKCINKLSYVEEPYCMKCGKPIDDEEKEFCTDCEKRIHNYDEGRSLFIYDEYMSRSIYRFKYNSKKEYALFYGKQISERLGDKIISWNADALIPVPIHKRKMAKRGFNQAYLIAKEISNNLNIPVNNKVLIRKNQTKVQKNLGAKERENNLKKAFKVKKNSVKLNTVVIIDDIYTTGSTIDAISATLKQSGVEKVYFITLSIGRGI